MLLCERCVIKSAAFSFLANCAFGFPLFDVTDVTRLWQRLESWSPNLWDACCRV